MTAPLPLDPADFMPRFDAAAREAGFKAERYGEINGHPLLAYTKRTSGPRPRVYLSSGMHGDEPAPPRALLRLVEEGFFDARCNWFVCPLLNPTGFLRGTRANFAAVDLNRDYKDQRRAETRDHIAWLHRQPGFDVTICLHEDYEAAGFYLYELNPDNRPTLAHAMIAAARALGLIESAAIIDGRESAEPGIIRPISDPLLRESWPEAIYLRNFHSTLNYTQETPTGAPMEQRVATQCAAVRAALAELRSTRA